MRSGYAPPLAGTPTATVEVDTVVKEVTKVSTVREIGGAGVPGVTSTAAASGSVEWSGSVTTAATAPSPWNRVGNFPPAPGSAVRVSTGTVETGTFSALTGVVDDSSAGADGIVTSAIIDPVDRLHRELTLPPLLASMPPLEYGGEIRNIGLSSDYIVDTALRRCGVFSTPYQPASISGVNVPGQGSAWPARGTCTNAGQYTDQGQAVAFLSTEWGWGIYDGNMSYTPDGSFTPAAGAEISCMVSQFHAATSDITIYMTGTTHFFRLQIGGSGTVTAQYYNGTTTTTIASLPAATGWRRVSLRVSAGSIWIGTDDGRAASGTHTAPSSVTTAVVTRVQVRVLRGGRIGGIIVGNMPVGNYFSQLLTARLWAGTNLNPNLVASPRIEGQDALDLIGDIAAATCRAYWWDEDGLFHWMPGDYMLLRASALTLTSKDNLLDLGWSESLSDTYANVTVDHQPPVVSRSKTPSVMVWQGSGDSMGSSERVEEIATPSTDEDWIQVNSSPRTAWDAAWANDFNHGRFSIVGGVRTDGTNTWWANPELTTSTSIIGPFAWKFTHETSGVAAGQSVQRAMPNDNAWTPLWQRWRNEKLPILRAYGKVAWATDSITQGSGVGNAGSYRHDGGRWVQGYSGETPGRIATFLETWLCQPRIKATGVSVVFDPRIQVGDIVTVRDEHAHGIELKVLVTRVEQSTAAADQSMSLDFFVIDGDPAWATLALHDSVQGGTFTGHNTAQGGEALTDHNADPLHID